MANTSLYVLDAAIDPVPEGCTGELHIGGFALGDGYPGDPAATAQSFIPDPFSDTPGARLYRSGDLARSHAGGTFEILGRRDRQIKVNGIRVEPTEIESRLAELPEIRESAVLLMAEDGNGHLVAVLATSTPRAEVEVRARAHLHAALPVSMQPARYLIVPDLPHTDRGKIDFQRLLALAERERPAAFIAPRNKTETIVAEVWRAVLKLDDIGVNDDFFMSGGHSLLFAQLIIRLKERFGVGLPLKAVFQNPTVAALAAYIDAARKPDGGAGGR